MFSDDIAILPSMRFACCCYNTPRPVDTQCIIRSVVLKFLSIMRHREKRTLYYYRTQLVNKIVPLSIFRLNASDRMCFFMFMTDRDIYVGRV